jgi:hypothetical protein
MTVSEAAKKWRLPPEMVHAWLVQGKIPGASANYIPDYIVAQGRPFPTGHFGAKFHNAHQDAEDAKVIANSRKRHQ